MKIQPIEIGIYFRFDHSFVHSLYANPSFSLKIFPSEIHFERSDSDDRLILQFLIREVQHGVFLNFPFSFALCPNFLSAMRI